ncbi:MAG: DsbA family oxidoreductase, partial [Roseiflexaceae bacterium]
MTTLTVDMFSDIVCPWCVIGGVRLDKALAQRSDITINKYWHPYMLNPDQPAGVDWHNFVESKFGGSERAAQMFENVTNVAASEGLTFDFMSIVSSPNTRDCHRLMILAGNHGLTWQLAPLLYNGHFRDSLDLNDHVVLHRLATQAGLPADEVTEVLNGDTFNDGVDESLMTAQHLGIRGVPFFIFNRRLAVSGAQPVEVMLQAIDKALAVD